MAVVISAAEMKRLIDAKGEAAKRLIAAEEDRATLDAAAASAWTRAAESRKALCELRSKHKTCLDAAYRYSALALLVAPMESVLEAARLDADLAEEEHSEASSAALMATTAVQELEAINEALQCCIDASAVEAPTASLAFVHEVW